MKLDLRFRWVGICLAIILGYSVLSYGQKSAAGDVSDFVITVTFQEEPEDPVNAFKAPLKYNKDFALILQMDDSSPTLYTQVLPYFKGEQGFPGLFYGDGVFGTHHFKMEAAHFSFDGNGTDLHDDVPGFLSWQQMQSLWQNRFGLTNHGLTDPATADVEMDVRRNISYTQRNTASPGNEAGIKMQTYVVPGINASHIPVAKQHHLAVFHEGMSAISDPVRVEDLPPIEGLEIKRRSITNNLFQEVQTTANMSDSANHYITTYFNHGFIPQDITFAEFQEQLNMIAATYGAGGSDRLWSATSAEVFEYLRLRELISMHASQQGNVLTLTFSADDLPVDFRDYELSIVVEGESLILSLEVDDPGGMSSYTSDGNNALINLRWDGHVPVDLLERAQEYVTIAEAQPTPANALIAMDYVIMLPEGEPKEELRQQLLNLDDIPYEPGFYSFFGEDIEACKGDTITLEALNGQAWEWSTGDNTQAIAIVADTNVSIWANVTLSPGNVVSDTLFLTVHPLPDVAVKPDSASIAPGDELMLTASGAEIYIWSTGDTTNMIPIAPMQSGFYWVEGTSGVGCVNRDTAYVNVVYTTSVDFNANDVCLGDTTYLISHIHTDDSILIKEWDLTGDGVFEFVDDIDADSLVIRFDEPGEKLIGLRLKTLNGGIFIKYHPVIVADFPQADFIFENTCQGQTTEFFDKSTQMVGNIQTRQWFFGDGNISMDTDPVNLYEDTGTYETQLIVVSVYGCSDTTRKQLQISEVPVFELRLGDGTLVYDNQQLELPLGDTLSFEVVGLFDSILWNDTFRGNRLNVINGDDFEVAVYLNNCSATRYFSVIETGVPPGPQPKVDIMNLITPNGNGYNDYWLIRDLDAMRPAKVVIYNRSGRPVYQSNDYQNDWGGTYNGNPLPEGTYFYVIEGANGQVIKGPLSILR